MKQKSRRERANCDGAKDISLISSISPSSSIRRPYFHFGTACNLVASTLLSLFCLSLPVDFNSSPVRLLSVNTWIPFVVKVKKVFSIHQLISSCEEHLSLLHLESSFRHLLPKKCILRFHVWLMLLRLRLLAVDSSKKFSIQFFSLHPHLHLQFALLLECDKGVFAIGSLDAFQLKRGRES